MEGVPEIHLGLFSLRSLMRTPTNVIGQVTLGVKSVKTPDIYNNKSS